jgi:tetratricopeptide (TPR) repeat protein
VFWKVVEFLVRIIYFRRFRAAKKIGEAGSLLSEGRPGEALELLEQTGKRLHQSLLPLYALIRGRILDALGRVEEAEEAFKLVVLTDPESAKGDLELAVLTGRQFRFDECRTWLDRLEAKHDPETRARAEGIRELLDQITSGEREAEFERRARSMAETPLGADGRCAGLPPDLELLTERLRREPEAARERLDELALLIGQGEVERGARWRISLSIEESVVVRDDGFRLNPFEVVDAAIGEGTTALVELLADAWRPAEP